MVLTDNSGYVEVPLDESLLFNIEEEYWYDEEDLQKLKMIRWGTALCLVTIVLGFITFYCYSTYQGEFETYLKYLKM